MRARVLVSIVLLLFRRKTANINFARMVLLFLRSDWKCLTRIYRKKSKSLSVQLQRALLRKHVVMIFMLIDDNTTAVIDIRLNKLG